MLVLLVLAVVGLARHHQPHEQVEAVSSVPPRVFPTEASRSFDRYSEPPTSSVPPTTIRVAPRPRPASEHTHAPPAPAATVPASSGPCRGRQPTRAASDACWAPLVAAYRWPVQTALRILYCESTGDPNAANGRYHGLFQVDGASFDPAANVAAAFGYWVRRGWQPWACA